VKSYPAYRGRLFSKTGLTLSKALVRLLQPLNLGIIRGMDKNTKPEFWRALPLEKTGQAI